jgi:lysophospholipase L1-like esterase
MNGFHRSGRGHFAAIESRLPGTRRMQLAVRRTLRFLVLIGYIAAPLVAGAPSASAASRTSVSALPVTPGSSYLALGDSVTFGYEEAQVVPAPDYADASSFVAYPEMLGAELRLKVANAACPGETSASLINPKAQSNGCENTVSRSQVAYRKQHPLHVSYTGSQLSYATTYLRTHSNVRLVSLMIGANDLLLCQETTHDGCVSATEQAATDAKLARNVRVILSAIRDKAHYRGQLAIVNYYSPNYDSAFLDAASTGLNASVDKAAKPFGVEIADGYGELRAASVHAGGNTCLAGLLTQLGKPGTCGVHPSYAGQALLAQALEKAIRL